MNDLIISSFLESFDKIKFNLKRYKKKLRPTMTLKVIFNFMKTLQLLNVNIHRKFYHNTFINKFARKNLAQIPYPFVRCRRNFVPNNKVCNIILSIAKNQIEMKNPSLMLILFLRLIHI